MLTYLEFRNPSMLTEKSTNFLVLLFQRKSKDCLNLFKIITTKWAQSALKAELLYISFFNFKQMFKSFGKANITISIFKKKDNCAGILQFL